MKDKELLKKLHKDPNDGMNILMERYAGLVYAVVRSKLPGDCYSTDVEDCVADVFSEFWCDLENFDSDKGSIKSYLCVIAKHNALDIARKRAKDRANVSLDDEESRIQLADLFSVEADYLEEEGRQEIMREINALGKPDRDIIIAKFYFSRSSKEIAEKLGMTVSNVDTRTHRALEKLRNKLGGKKL